mmetsp:Transcript_23304/g.40399  ORF Transcript_23304/g.40399 Transcript_23304/m.40399 type:complete len:92 (-) Transcript_23304:334-609(-)
MGTCLARGGFSAIGAFLSDLIQMTGLWPDMILECIGIRARISETLRGLPIDPSGRIFLNREDHCTADVRSVSLVLRPGILYVAGNAATGAP